MTCECGDKWACELCGECVTPGCGPGRADCDVVHCDDPYCRHECSLCKLMARMERRTA